jgi:hypothetical protein
MSDPVRVILVGKGDRTEMSRADEGVIPSCPVAVSISTVAPFTPAVAMPAMTSCAAAGALTSLAPWLGFTPLPPLFFAVLLVMIVSYLGLVEIVKRWFYRRYPM